MTPAGRDHPDIHVQHGTAAAKVSRFRSGQDPRRSSALLPRLNGEPGRGGRAVSRPLRTAMKEGLLW
jgi:hypothetical protein